MLTNRVPHPAWDGGALAMQALLKGYLAAGHAVSLLAFNTERQWVQLKELPDWYRELELFETVYLDSRLSVLPALWNLLFSTAAYHFSRFQSDDFVQALKRLLQKQHFDIVQIEGAQLFDYANVVRAYSKAKLVFRSHNIEHAVWSSVSVREANLFKKWYLQEMARRIRKTEQQGIGLADALLVISPEDAQVYRQWGYAGPIQWVPYGVEAVLPVHFQERVESFCFLGSLDWAPNQQAVLFLLKLWPKVLGRGASLRLTIAGSRPPRWLQKRKTAGVDLQWDVKDAAALLCSFPVVVMPIFSGGGLRVKLIEALAWGRCVITTSFALQGIRGLSPGVHVLLAEDEAGFLELIAWCQAHPVEVSAIGRQAQLFIKENYLQAGILQAANHFLEQLLVPTTVAG